MMILRATQTRKTKGTIFVPKLMAAEMGHPTSMTVRFRLKRSVIAVAAGVTALPIKPMTRFMAVSPIPMVNPERKALDSFNPSANNGYLIRDIRT